jgi:hypothetical protein
MGRRSLLPRVPVPGGHWENVRALNLANGDTRAASDMLGVADLIEQILGEAQEIVDGALGGLSLV